MSLFEKRVEAASEVLLRDYQSEYDGGEVSEFLDVARAVLEAADAVMTEGEVEEALFQAFKDWDESGDLFTVQARAVMMLFRGGAK